MDTFSLDCFSLATKTAVVTGGAGGIGRALSMAMAKAGANVLATGRRPLNPDFENDVLSTGVDFKYLQSDLTEDGSCKAAIDACLAAWGQIDILINCAGQSINVQDVTKFTRQEWDQMIAVNLTASFEMIHQACPHMIARKTGKIINVASLYSFLGGRWSPAYASSKHGIVGLTKAMCDELAEHNIQVNAIAPGFYATPLTEDTRNDPTRSAEILARIPSNRWGELKDLMGAAVFLASPASDYVNGTVLTVDGGYMVR